MNLTYQSVSGLMVWWMDALRMRTEGWIVTVWLVDQNTHADQQFEMFHALCLLPPMLPVPPTKPPIRWVLAPLPALAPALAVQGPVPWAPAAAPPAKISMGVSMDIDTARRKGEAPPSMCCCCRKPGH